MLGSTIPFPKAQALYDRYKEPGKNRPSGMNATMTGWANMRGGDGSGTSTGPSQVIGGGPSAAAQPVAPATPAWQRAVPLGAGNMTLAQRWAQMPSRQVQPAATPAAQSAQAAAKGGEWMGGASELDAVLNNPLYSGSDIARKSNRYMTSGHQAAASAMAQPSEFSGFAANSPGLLYGNTMGAAQAIGAGKQGQLESQLADMISNADFRLQGEQGRAQDILAQKGNAATRSGAQSRFQQGMANAMLSNLGNQFGAFSNKATNGLGDAAWWANYGVRNDSLGQNNLMSMLQAMLNWGAI